jgi:hypothetical protein
MSLIVKSFPRGALVRVTATFTDALGVAVDPDSVTVRTLGPAVDQVSKVYEVDDEVVRDAAGEYHYDIDTTDEGAGTWAYRWEGTGVGQAAKESTFKVNTSAFSFGSP